MVASLRAWMQKENMDCFIVPSDDPHLRYVRGHGFYPHKLLRCKRQLLMWEPVSKFRGVKKVSSVFDVCACRQVVGWSVVLFFPYRFPNSL